LSTLAKVDLFNVKIEQEAWEIGEAFLKSILFEVSAYPKPGLVCSGSAGSHQDMNILTFMASSATIGPAFYLCAQAGRSHGGAIKDLLPKLRKIGLVYERKLLEATKGINTQRGLLFVAGLTCGVAGYLSQRHSNFRAEEICTAMSEMTEGIVARELVNIKKAAKDKLTAGEQLYLAYKVTGIRGEVEAGLPAVKNAGLPALKAAIQEGYRLNDCLVHVLISLMTCVEDTTILWRKGQATLKKVQDWSQKVLNKGSVFTPEGWQEIYKMEEHFLQENISPGGSADLLAITIGLYLLENKQLPVAIL
jgi:triphosphoribosyl-dephospho-CoA synthase